MNFTPVNYTQVIDHAQLISVTASLLCGGFSSYLILRYRSIYPAANKFLLWCIVILSVLFLETARHTAIAAETGRIMLADHGMVLALGACVVSISFGLLLVLMVWNHDRLVATIRRTFKETTCIATDTHCMRYTRTQRIRILEKTNVEDILKTLNLITSSSSLRLLKTMNLVGWGLIVANLCFMAVIELGNHLN